MKQKANPTQIHKRWAFLVGIDKYNTFPDLDYCSADMRLLRQALIDHGGYQAQNIKLITFNDESKLTVSSGGILVDLMNMLEKVGPADSILFAFAGHGDIDTTGKAWLMAPDAKPGATNVMKYTAIPVRKIYDELRSSSARQKLIVLDACHSGGSRGANAVTKLTLNDIEPGEGIVELLSCDADQLSYEDKELGHGVFSSYLAKGLEGQADIAGDQNGLVTVDEVFDFAYLNTKNHVQEKYRKQQTPRKRTDVSGEVVVAVRTLKKLKLAKNDLLVKLNDLERNKTLPPNFAAQAARWMRADSSLNARNKIELLLNLVANESINLPDFFLLAGNEIKEIDYHLEAKQLFENRKLFLIAVGINNYQETIPSLLGSKSDARLAATTVRQHAGKNCEVIVLSDEQATKPAILNAIKTCFLHAKEKDIVCVYFAGHGMCSPFESGGLANASLPVGKESEAKMEFAKRKLRSNCWVTYDTQGSPEKNRDGLVNISKSSTWLESSISSKDLLSIIDRGKADCLIVSDTSFDMPWPSLLPESGNKNEELSAEKHSKVLPNRPLKRSLVFVGLESAFDNPDTNSQLSLLFSRAISGAADGSAYNPAAINSFKQSMKQNENDLAAGTVSPQQDGFVSIEELVQLVKGYRDQSKTFFGSQLFLRGQIGSRPSIISRSD